MQNVKKALGSTMLFMRNILCAIVYGFKLNVAAQFLREHVTLEAVNVWTTGWRRLVSAAALTTALLSIRFLLPNPQPTIYYSFGQATGDWVTAHRWVTVTVGFVIVWGLLILALGVLHHSTTTTLERRRRHSVDDHVYVRPYYSGRDS